MVNNRIRIFNLTNEKPSVNDADGLYVVKSKNNSKRELFFVMLGYPVKIFSTSDYYTIRQVDDLCNKQYNTFYDIIQEVLSKLKDIESGAYNLRISKSYDTEDERVKDKKPIGDDGVPLVAGNLCLVKETGFIYLWTGNEWITQTSLSIIVSRVFDGGRANSNYGGSRNINGGKAID